MLVLGNDYKHPAVTAKEAATLDVLSDGRLEFGLGAGWMTRRLRGARASATTRPGVRIDRLGGSDRDREARLGADGPFSFAGEHYAIRDYDAVPKPVQQPRPPILLGGGGPQDAAARRPRRPTSSASTRTCAPARSAPTSRATAAKTSCCRRSTGSVKARGTASTTSSSRCATSLTAITDDARGLAEQLAPLFGITADEALASSVVLAGTVDEVCDTLERRREEWGVSYVVVGDDAFDAFAPVVARLAGT